MYILGLHNDEDSGVCLLKNGKIIDIINEERLTRKKLQGGFPKKSIEYILQKNRISLKKIDFFAYGWHGRQNNFLKYIEKLLSRISKCNLQDKKIKNLIFERLRVEFGRDDFTFKKYITEAEKFGIPKSKTFFFDHHSCHAWSAFSCSKFNNALVFTMDARGDLKSASVSIASKKNGLKEITNNLSFDSLGFLYGQITHYLGYKPHRHEGKITGLAGYGDYKKTIHIFRKLIKWDKTKIVSNLGYYRPFFTNINKDLKKDLKKHTREDIAAGVQFHCEDIVVKFIKYWIKKLNNNKPTNICLAGGLFANVKINQKIFEINKVKEVFVFPHMGDGGLTIGAACRMNFQVTKKSKVNLNHVYYGPSFSKQEIMIQLKKYKKILNFYSSKNLKVDATNLLLDDKVLGFFSGRMEFGPRALGARSILFNTKDKNANNWLNKRLKRTEFMPFAPVTTFKLANKCFKNWKQTDACTPFMTKTFKCKNDFVKKNPAVVHVDRTARPQVINRKYNKSYYDIINHYCLKSGQHSLINTSFNQHEEPIVCSPKDAIKSLLSNNVDYLIIENFIIRKN